MEIAEQEEISQKYFWFLVNKTRKPKQNSSVTPITFPSGTTACDPESLTEEWRHYFEELSKPVDHPNFDATFKGTVERRLHKLTELSHSNHDRFLRVPISEEENSKAVKQLK